MPPSTLALPGGVSCISCISVLMTAVGGALGTSIWGTEACLQSSNLTPGGVAMLASESAAVKVGLRRLRGVLVEGGEA